MTTASRVSTKRTPFHPYAYQFVFDALRHTQESLGRDLTPPAEPETLGESSHLSCRELTEGFRELALQKFGLLARTVLEHWGVRTTGDIGRIVFELIERGEMHKTEDDCIEDFFDVYDFEEVFESSYRIDVTDAFSR